MVRGMRVVRAMMSRMIGVEVLALVVGARVAPMADSLGVVPRRGGHETAAAVVAVVTMMIVVKKGEGGRWRHYAPRKTHDEGESERVPHDFLSPVTNSRRPTPPLDLGDRKGGDHTHGAN